MSITSGAVARFDNKLDDLNMGTFQIALLGRLAQLSTELLNHREIRVEKIKPYNVGFEGRPVGGANPPVQISRDTD